MRRVLRVLLVLIVLIGAAGLALHFYLHSARATRQVAERLEALYGGPVEVGGIDVGLNSSSVQGLKLYDKPAAGHEAHAWVEVKSVHADVSLWEMIRGAALPRRLVLQAPTIVLYFDRNGRLLTQLPLDAQGESNIDKLLAEAPELDLEGGEVILKKEGHPDLVAHQVTAHLTREGGALVLTGSGENDVAGKLLLSGQLKSGSNQVHVNLKTEHAAEVDQAFLERVPFVPAGVWQELQVTRSESTAELNVDYDLKERNFHYRLDLAPRKTVASIPALEVTAQGAEGSVSVEDYLVHVRQVSAHAFDGTILVHHGELDFRGDVEKFDFSKIEAKGLDVSKLPPSWKFPPQIKGQLYGTAEAHVTIGPGRFDPAAIGALLASMDMAEGLPWRSSATAYAAFPHAELHIDGKGKGEIRDASVGGIKTDGPVGIRWRPEGWETDSTGSTGTPEALLAIALGTTALLQQPSQSSPVLDYPLRAVDTVMNGVEKVSEGIADAVHAVTRRLPTALKPAAPGEKTSYVEVNLKLKDVDLSQLVTKLGKKLPFAVSGKASLQVKASLPLNRATDVKAYKAHGSAQLKDLRLENLHVPQASADLVYEDGVLELKSLDGRFAPEPPAGAGTFKGSARLQVVPLGELTADLILDHVPLDQVPVPGEQKLQLGGAVSGKFGLRVPGDQLKSGAAWDATGELNGERLAALGLNLRDFAASLRLRLGILSVSKLQGRLEGAPLTGQGQLVLTGSFPFSSKLNLAGLDIAALDHVAPQFRPPYHLAGKLAVSADLRGKLQPVTVNATGDLTASGLKIENFALQDVKTHWELLDKQLILSNLDTHLYGGEITGKAVLPLAASEQGSVNLHLDKIDVQEFVKALPVPFKVEGKVQGDIKAVLPPAPAGNERTATATVDLTAPALRIQNIPAEKLHATVLYKKGELDYKVEGSTLGGTFDLEGQVPISTQPASKENKEGRLKVRNLQLGRLADAFRLQALAPLAGRVNLDVVFTHSAKSKLPNGQGTLRLTDLTWHERPVANNLEGKLNVTDGVVRLQDLSGSLAQGIFRAQLAYDLVHPERGRFNLILDNVEVSQLLAFADQRKAPIEGPLNARIRGNFGNEWRGTADLELNRGKVYGLDVSNWHLPSTWAFAPSQGRAHVEVYETTAHVTGGQARGRLSLTTDIAAQVDGFVQFNGLDLQNLLRETTGSTSLGSGTLAGKFDFTGRDVRTIDDLSGQLKASFGPTQALQVPGLSAITPYLGIGPTTTFQKGSVVGRLDRGIFRIEKLTLEGTSADIFVNGTVALSGGLDLEMVARTGFVGLPVLPMRLLGLRLPVAGPVPLVLIQQASTLLSNRVLYLHVSGTVRSPSIRLEPLRTLTQEAVRFFIYRSSGASSGL